PVRRRLHREHHPPLQVLLGPLELACAQPSRRDLRDLGHADLDARIEVLLARADVDADQARVALLGREAVDGVRHAALLAYLLEQPRRGRAAEDAVEQRGGEAAAVGARDAGRAEAQVILLGLLVLEAEARRRLLHERAAHARPGVPGLGAAA